MPNNVKLHTYSTPSESCWYARRQQGLRAKLQNGLDHPCAEFQFESQLREGAETTGWSRGTTCAQPPALSAEARATHHAQAHSVYALVDARIALPISFFQKKFKPIGACPGDSIASLCLPGHLIPATFFNDFSSLPATYVPSSLSFFSWFGCFINWATQIAA